MDRADRVAYVADMMDIDEHTAPTQPTWAAAAAAAQEYDQEMLDAEVLIEQADRGAQDGEAEDDDVAATAAEEASDEDPLADLEAAAERDDISINGEMDDVSADGPADEQEPPVYVHLVEKIGGTSTSKFVQVEYDPNAIQVTIDFNRIAARIQSSTKRPELDTVHLGHGHSDEEILLGYVAHPDDIAGSLLLRIVTSLSTMELAERVNALYFCCKMQLNSSNAFTQRVAQAGDAQGVRNGWSTEETAREKARIRNMRPNAHSTAIPLRQYTFVNRPGGDEPEEKTKWTKPQMKKNAPPEAVSLSTRHRNRPRNSAARGESTLLLAPQPVQHEDVPVGETAEPDASDNEEAITDEQIGAGLLHHDPETSALYAELAKRRETFADLERQLAEKKRGGDA